VASSHRPQKTVASENFAGATEMAAKCFAAAMTDQLQWNAVLETANPTVVLYLVVEGVENLQAIQVISNVLEYEVASRSLAWCWTFGLLAE